MAMAARPTAFIDIAENTNGNIPPINNPAMISGRDTSMESNVLLFS